MKRIIALALCVGLVFLLAGCGGDGLPKVGDKVEFGSYHYAISWKVAEKDGKNLLLICDSILDWCRYDDYGKTSWQSSSLRQWLNNEFIYDAFSESERAKILTTSVDNARDGYTQDRIFLLSTDQIDRYLSDGGEKWGYMSSYAMDNGRERSPGIYFSPAVEYEWWTRTPSSESGEMTIIAGFGSIASYPANRYLGVRPAVWVTDWEKK